MKFTDLIYRLVALFSPRDHPWFGILALVLVLSFAAAALLIVVKAGVGATVVATSVGLAAKRLLR